MKKYPWVRIKKKNNEEVEEGIMGINGNRKNTKITIKNNKAIYPSFFLEGKNLLNLKE